jgi:Flp pilus assembly protein TadD
MRWLSIACLYAALATGHAAAQTAAVLEAIAAMERGDFPTAERMLRDEVMARPDDAAALSLLGTALDNEKKTSEADEVYRRAIAKAPR